MKTTKKTILKLTGIALIAAAFITGCKKDEDKVEEPHEHTHDSEVVTTLRLTFVDSAGLAPTVTAQFRDPDGDGGNAPLAFDTIRLLPNKTYLAEVLLLNETKNPADTISNEVIEEANEHLFFYTPVNVNATVTITDLDSNTPPLPLGITTKWKTQAVSTGTVRVVLRHQPDAKDGTYAPGETDIDLTFQAVVE